MSIYIQQLSNLNTARIAGKNAPHKAILLLSIMELIEIGDITNPRIELTEKLEKTFNTVWKKYIGTSLIFRPMVATPFWHMGNEPFYRLFLKNGSEIGGANGKYSVKWLRENTYATIDKELFELMKDETYRAQLRVILVSTYLKGLHANTEAMLSILAILGVFVPLAA